jgi:GTPase involved in cell partitioning and DNA repair
VITCRATKSRDLPSTKPISLIKEAHKYFDHAMITVRSGDGGHGAVLTMPSQSNDTSKDKKKRSFTSSFKREPDGSLILPMGGHGGDVIIYADESLDSLLEFHNKNRYCAKRGGNVDAMGTLNSQMHDGLPASALRIPVPVGLWVSSYMDLFLTSYINFNAILSW